MRIKIILFLLFAGAANASMLSAQVPVQIFEQQIPVYRWTVNSPQGDHSAYFMPDKDQIEYCRLRFENGDSARLICADLKSHTQILQAQTSGKYKQEKSLRKLDSVFFPSLYQVYLYKQGGKYGLIAQNGTGIAAPVYDQIAFLYQYVASRQAWLMTPMLLVCKDRQYALMDISGFVVTRFCKSVEELPSAYMLNKANEFKLNQKVTPESLWGY